MTATRFTNILALAAIGICILSCVTVIHAEAETDAQLSLLARQLARLHGVPATRDQTCSVLSTTDIDRLGDEVAAAALSKLRGRMPATAAVEAATSAGSTDSQRRAARRAEQIFRQAISRGILTRKAVLQMRELKLRSGGGAGFDNLNREIFQALNQKQLTAEDPTLVIP